MTQAKIAVIGLGLIGTSFGLNLTKNKKRNYTVVGYDIERGRERTAEKAGAIDKRSGSIKEAVTDANVVIIATPPLAAKTVLEELKDYVHGDALVTDTCSTKAEFLDHATRILPKSVNIIGGHPLAGSDESGPSAAKTDLFEGAAWALTPSTTASETSVKTILALIEQTGAYPVFVDPIEHDQHVASVSHVPLLLSVALFRMVRDSNFWDDASVLAGPAFNEMTRLAKGDPEMGRGIIETNQTALTAWLKNYRDELGIIIEGLEAGHDIIGEVQEKESDDDEENLRAVSGYEMLTSLLQQTQTERLIFDEIPKGRQIPETGDGTTPTFGDTMGQMLMGGYLYGRLKDRMQDLDRKEEELKRRER